MIEVSVVIPVFNDLRAIKLTIEALSKQTVSRSRFEIIIIDNGSLDGSVEYLKTVKGITFLEENDHEGSPYSCRNRGIEIAKGEIIALLDSTCIPDENWLQNGLAFMEQTKCKMFGGNVRFTFDGNKTSAKIYDSITHVQMEENIKHSQKAKTANFWVNKSLFNEFGFFREGVRSGEDVRWSSHCAENGYKIFYSDNCTVYKFARDLKSLLSKHYRIGIGQAIRWKNQNSVKRELRSKLRIVLPKKPRHLRKKLQKSPDVEYSSSLLVKVYVIDYIANLLTLCGNLVCVFRRR